MSERRKKRVPAREKLNMFHALQERGYYDKNNNWNKTFRKISYFGTNKK